MACAGKLSARGKTLTDATDHYLDYLDRSAKPLLWSELVKKIVESKEQDGRAERYTQDLDSRLGMLATDRGDRLVSDYSTDELDKWLRDMRVRKQGHKNFGEPIGVTTRNNTRRLLVVAFNIAITAGACATNPAEKIPVANPPRPEHDDDDGEDVREVTMQDILLPIELAVLLLVAEPGLLPYLALAAFCGLRRAELRRIAWRRIEWDKSRIYVPGRVGKRAARWVQLRAAYAFLLPYKGRAGLITPRNFRESLDRARLLAADLLDAHKVEGRLSAWPQNCLRHGFASYHYSFFGDAKGLATEMGHRSTDLIFTSYREPAPIELAEQFWGLSPVLVDAGRTGGVPALLKALHGSQDAPPVEAQELA